MNSLAVQDGAVGEDLEKRAELAAVVGSNQRELSDDRVGLGRCAARARLRDQAAAGVRSTSALLGSSSASAGRPTAVWQRARVGAASPQWTTRYCRSGRGARSGSVRRPDRGAGPVLRSRDREQPGSLLAMSSSRDALPTSLPVLAFGMGPPRWFRSRRRGLPLHCGRTIQDLINRALRQRFAFPERLRPDEHREQYLVERGGSERSRVRGGGRPWGSSLSPVGRLLGSDQFHDGALHEHRPEARRDPVGCPHRDDSPNRISKVSLKMKQDCSRPPPGDEKIPDAREKALTTDLDGRTSPRGSPFRGPTGCQG